MSWLNSNEFKGLNPVLLARMNLAQDELNWIGAASARALVEIACNQLGATMAAVDAAPSDMSAFDFGNMPHRELTDLFKPLFPGGTSLADDLADQVQLCRAFSDPAHILSVVTGHVINAAAKFPHSAEDLKVGDNKGDVLDPFILAANYELLSNRSLSRTVETSLSHKVLMKIEDLVGKMHEVVLGAMRGNFNIPEPQRGLGGTKEVIQPYTNPFPGADIGQVPTPDKPAAIRLFQVKNKTGSATGGDGARLGRQLTMEQELFSLLLSATPCAAIDRWGQFFASHPIRLYWSGMPPWTNWRDHSRARSCC